MLMLLRVRQRQKAARLTVRIGEKKTRASRWDLISTREEESVVLYSGAQNLLQGFPPIKFYEEHRKERGGGGIMRQMGASTKYCNAQLLVSVGRAQYPLKDIRENQIYKRGNLSGPGMVVGYWGRRWQLDFLSNIRPCEYTKLEV